MTSASDEPAGLQAQSMGTDHETMRSSAFDEPADLPSLASNFGEIFVQIGSKSMEQELVQARRLHSAHGGDKIRQLAL